MNQGAGLMIWRVIMKDRSNTKLGMITITGIHGRNKGGDIIWNAVCECGRKITPSESNLRRKSKLPKSCGCAKVKHGLHKSRAYEIWHGIMKRCYNESAISYKNYGGRGIRVCDRWHDINKFIEDMGDCESGLQIERIDNNGNYEPLNCAWATPKQQARNRRSNLLVEFRGKTKPLIVWCDELQLKYSTVRARLKVLGWSSDRAFSTPTR